MAKEFGKAVIIGLGGCGQAALIRIKKMFLDRYGEVPPCIKLIAFDTSSNQDELSDAQGKIITFDKKEFCHLRVGSIRTAIENKYVKEWWISYPPLDPVIVNEGTGGIREVGRLAVFANIEVVKERIEKAFVAVNDFSIEQQMRERGMELLSITPQVFVIGSFAGGTGSGAFFDMSILCRALGGLDWFYSAFFVMPWVYRNIAKTAYENGYATLLELENLNSCSPETQYNIQYGPDPDLQVTLEYRPYHVVNLVDGKCRNNYKIQGHRELSQFIGECIFNSVGAIGEKAADVVNNMLSIMISFSQSADWEGRQALYSTFGVSAIVYPGKQIHERVSLKYAIGLIDQTTQYIEAPEKLPLDEMLVEIQTFIAEKGIEPGMDGLLKKVLPENTLKSYCMDGDINLHSSDLRSEVERDVENWEKRQHNECMRILGDNGDRIKKEISKDISTLLQRIADGENKGTSPKGSYESANRLLIDFLTNAQKELTNMKDNLTRDRNCLDEKLKNCSRALSERRAWRPFSTNPARNAYSNYARTREEMLRTVIGIACCEKVLELYGTWAEEAKIREQKIFGGGQKQVSVQKRLMDLKSALLTRYAGLSDEDLIKGKSLFEIYVGINLKKDTDTVYLKEGFELPSADKDFKGFLIDNNITSRDFFNNLTPGQLHDLFMDYSRKRLHPLTDVSVLDVLKKLEEETEGKMKEIVTQAVKNATHLLPVDDDKLAAKGRLLSEFTVIGGEDKGKIEEKLSELIPPSRNPDVHNLWASTGDKHRITVCSYFAAVPLHLLKDIKEIRSAYWERVFPPAHIDRKFEFTLPDVMPESDVEVRVLKLLALAMLDSVKLITRVERTDDTKFYRLDPQVLLGDEYIQDGTKFYRLNSDGGKYFIDEEDLQLPGKPGKFYSLYAEVCKDLDLQEKLKTALLKLDQKKGFKEILLNDIKTREGEFKETLADKIFTKMMTGNFYRQQTAFYQNMLKNNLGIKEAMKDENKEKIKH